MSKSNSFRDGKVSGYLRGQVWYLCYFEQGKRRRPRAKPLLVLAAGSTNAYSEMPLHDGKSQVFSLSSRARRIVLLKAGAAVGSVELVFQPDRVTEVEG